MKRINETIKKIQDGTSKVTLPTTSNTEPEKNQEPVCPICGGLGYIRQELPIAHPDFGKLKQCVCQQQKVSRAAHTPVPDEQPGCF